MISSGNCSYAFIVENSSFNFHGAVDLQDPKFTDRAVSSFPYVLDWFVANQTCMEAQSNLTSYVCQQNTSCIDVDKLLGVQGYRCQCLPGYEGNPYLNPGCTGNTSYLH